MACDYKLSENRKTIFVNDPIHGEYEIGEPFSEIILTKDMQRLKNITQTGFSQYEYPGLSQGERLSHSIGAFYVMEKIIEHIEENLAKYNIQISKNDKDIALSAMLLHDIGHGPFSHTCEKVTNYSHEKRTTDILLGDTEINKVLTNNFGKRKVKNIASFIANINDDEVSKSSFSNLLKSLVSHQIDADRLDYLLRDTYYAGLKSAIDLQKIIESMGVIVNESQEYELIIDKKGLTSIETVLLERFQRYRDLYYCDSSIIMDILFPIILEKYKDNMDNTHLTLSNGMIIKGAIPEQFKKLALDPKSSNLEEFLSMEDNQFLTSFEIIQELSVDEVLKYLVNKENIKDYQIFENSYTKEILIDKLKEIFPDHNLDNTTSVLESNIKIRLYKTDEGLKVSDGNRLIDLSEATNLIKPQETLEKDLLIVNQEILRIELKLSQEEFSKYKESVQKILRSMDRRPEEFELKYIILEEEIEKEKVLASFLENGFKLLKNYIKENDDEYYDDENLTLFSTGCSLRLRKVTKNGEVRYKATYKSPTGDGTLYSSRQEIEVELKEGNVQELRKKMKAKGIEFGFLDNPILNAKTQREDMIFQDENGVRVCVSVDKTKYINHMQINELGKEQESYDNMIEIEAVGEIADRIILNKIHKFLNIKFRDDLELNKQSKFERGINKTMQGYLL